MRFFRKLPLPHLLCAVLLGGCQTSAPAAPAALSSTDPETMAALQGVLASAMSTASVKIGPGDLTASSTISVLPPPPGPYEGRSVAKPTLFDIMMRGERCFVVRRDTGEEFSLGDIGCKLL